MCMYVCTVLYVCMYVCATIMYVYVFAVCKYVRVNFVFAS